MVNAIEIALVALALAACALRARRLPRPGGPRQLARTSSIAAGGAVIIAAVLALAGPSKRLLYWHTAQQLLIGDIATLMAAFGLSKAMLAPLSGGPLRFLRPLGKPMLALTLWAVDLVVWLLPGPAGAAIHSEWLGLLQRLLLIVCGLNMWRVLLHASAGGALRSVPARLSYLLLGRLTGVALACIAIWSPTIYYTHYLHGDSLSSISPLADQGIAGAIMLGEMAIVAAGLLGWLAVKIAHEAAAENQPLAAAAETDPGARSAPLLDTGL